MIRRLPLLATPCAALLATGVAAQNLEERVEALEKQNRELRETVDALDSDVEGLQLGDLFPVVGESRFGLGPAASKIYSKDQGLSIGGYGEFLFTQESGNTDVLDAQRAILYFGYRFDEKWVFNSEIEIEHGTTGASSGTTTSRGSVSLEFGYLDYLHDEALNFRAGLVLPPLGLINELHEPTTFLSANRPMTEQRIIPTTWRALGAGAFGEVGPFAYRAYAINSLDGDSFGAAGLRGGRQSGNRAAANDIAGVARIDYVDTPGLIAGVSVFYGDTGQDHLAGTNRIPDMDTAIFDVHVDYRNGPWWLRALYSTAWVDDAGQYNTATGQNLARRLEGYYGEVGFDILSELCPSSEQELLPYVRFEHIDTQADMPTGFAPQQNQEEDIWTFGLHYRPIPQVVIKTDFEEHQKTNDRFNMLLGFVF